MIVFARDGRLFGQRFDEKALRLLNAPTQLADHIGSYLDFAYFAASPRTLVYRAPEPPSQLTWFEKDGRVVERLGDPQHVAGLALAPSGNRVLFARHAPQSVVDQDLWLLDGAPPMPARRVTFAPTLEFWPVWAGNDRFVYGGGGGRAGVYRQAIGGERELLFKTGSGMGSRRAQSAMATRSYSRHFDVPAKARTSGCGQRPVLPKARRSLPVSSTRRTRSCPLTAIGSRTSRMKPAGTRCTLLAFSSTAQRGARR